jgi:four helix bundle protein
MLRVLWMKIERFEDIEAWKEARCLVRDIYRLFENNKDFSVREQIQKAAVSIMSNLAEGFDSGTNKEFIQFLVISRASVSEVKSLSYVAIDVGNINKDQFENILVRCTKITSLLNGFIRYLRSSIKQC